MAIAKKFIPLAASLLFIITIALITWLIKKTGYHITYSATPSMPKGFYLITPNKKVSQGDIVEFIMPTTTREFAKNKKWIPQNSSVIKYVFAVPNDHVCIHDQSIWINYKKVGKVYKFYEQNKLLPQTNFCGTLKKDQYVLLSTKNKRSFDSRYFGPVSLKEILGKAIPIFICNENVISHNNIKET